MGNNPKFNFLDVNINDFVKSFPHSANVKDAKTLKYVIVNEGDLKIFGLKKESDLVGKDVFDICKIMKGLCPEDYAETIHNYDLQVIKEKKIIVSSLVTVTSKTGHTFRLQPVKIPLFDSRRNVVGILATLLELTNYKIGNLYGKLFSN